MRPRLFQLLLFVLLTVLAPVVWGQDDVARALHHYKLGKKMYRIGKTERAIEELHTALGFREIYFEAQMLLARVLLETQRPKEAIAELLCIDLTEQGKVSYQKLLGQAYYQINKLEEAGQSLSYAIAEATTPDHELHYYLASVELRRGNAPNAISEAERALALAPRFAPARKLLSDAYLVSQNTVQAARELILYLGSVRNREEAAAIRERLKAINSLSRAKLESSVQASFVPPRIHKMPKAASTLEARRNRVEGAVKVEVLLGSDGLIKQVIVVQGLGFGLDEQAILAAKGISYTPAMYNDKPVSVWMGIYFIFIIVDDDEKQSKEKYKIAALTIR